MSGFWERVIIGIVVLVAILAVSYLAGGYVAGRMARFDGWRQGVGVFAVAVGMTLALALAAWGMIAARRDWRAKLAEAEAGEKAWRFGGNFG